MTDRFGPEHAHYIGPDPTSPGRGVSPEDPTGQLAFYVGDEVFDPKEIDTAFAHISTAISNVLIEIDRQNEGFLLDETRDHARRNKWVFEPTAYILSIVDGVDSLNENKWKRAFRLASRKAKDTTQEAFGSSKYTALHIDRLRSGVEEELDLRVLKQAIDVVGRQLNVDPQLAWATVFASVFDNSEEDEILPAMITIAEGFASYGVEYWKDAQLEAHRIKFRDIRPLIYEAKADDAEEAGKTSLAWQLRQRAIESYGLI